MKKIRNRLYGACAACGCAVHECECAEREQKAEVHEYTTFKSVSEELRLLADTPTLDVELAVS